MKTSYLGKNAKKMFKPKVAKNVVISLPFQNITISFQKLPHLVTLPLVNHIPKVVFTESRKQYMLVTTGDITSNDITNN